MRTEVGPFGPPLSFDVELLQDGLSSSFFKLLTGVSRQNCLLSVESDLGVSFSLFERCTLFCKEPLQFACFHCLPFCCCDGRSISINAT